jgi:hypothetical protein
VAVADCNLPRTNSPDAVFVETTTHARPGRTARPASLPHPHALCRTPCLPAGRSVTNNILSLFCYIQPAQNVSGPARANCGGEELLAGREAIHRGRLRGTVPRAKPWLQETLGQSLGPGESKSRIKQIRLTF